MKNKIILCLISLSALIHSPSYSESISTKDLNRLFTTTEQRNKLNAVRRQFQKGLYTEENSEDKPQAAYRFNGIIKKQGETETLWLNGISKQGRVDEYEDGRYRLKTPAGQIKIKPGQIYDPKQAKVEEAFKGQVSIK